MPTVTGSKKVTSPHDVTPSQSGKNPDLGGKNSDVGKDHGGGSSLERVTVNLTKRSVTAMDRITELTGDTKTDAINKALQFYGYIQEFLDSGGALYMREPGNSELDKIKLL